MPVTDPSSRSWCRAFAALMLVIGLLGLAWPRPVRALTTPTLPQVTRWTPAYTVPTPVGSEFVNGFRAPTPSQPSVGLKAGGTLIVPYLYQRVPLNDLWATLAITLNVWRVSDTAPYTANLVHSQSETHMAAAFTYQFEGRFNFVPPTPGVYFFQLTAGRAEPKAKPVYASSMVQLEVTAVQVAPTRLAITAPATIFPALGDNPWWGARATVFPANATAPLTWQGSHGLRVRPVHGSGTELTPLMPAAINWTPDRAGLPETLSVTSGPVHAAHPVLVGGLAALEVDLDQHRPSHFTHAPSGMASLAALVPGATWHYEWFRHLTARTAAGLSLIPGSAAALTAAHGVSNPSGQVTALSDAAVALQLARSGAAMRHARQAQRDGTPDVLQLVLTATVNGRAFTYSTNYAGFTVRQAPGTLTLQTPPQLAWRIGWAAFYNGQPQPLTQPTALQIRDTRSAEFGEATPWQLSAQLHSAPAGFPFALTLAGAGAPKRLLPNGPAQTVHQAPGGDATLPLTATATPLSPRVDRDHFSAVIDWTLTAASPPIAALP